MMDCKFQEFIMLILEKLPQGVIYPQITQAPVSNYADFLNFFRGGHTVADNVGGSVIGASPQAGMLNIAITSGYFTQTRSVAIDYELLSDNFLTAAGTGLI